MIIYYLFLYIIYRNSDYNTSGRLLAEAMMLQAKQYEEWLEVMKDFSTVFSTGDSKPISKLVDGIIEKSQGNSQVIPVNLY